MKLLLWLTLVYLSHTVLIRAERCPVHFKPEKEGKQCVSITSLDPLLALSWLTTEDTTHSHSKQNPKENKNVTQHCHIWSIRKQRIPNKCDNIDFSFETTWVNAGCKVTLTYSSYTSKCSQQVSRITSKIGCAFSNSVSNTPPPTDVHLLRVHDNHLGSVPAILSELYRQRNEHRRSILQRIPLISLDLVMYPAALHDIGAGDSSAHAWQLWSAWYLLQSEIFTVTRVMPYTAKDFKNKPLQYTDALDLVNIDPHIPRYDIILTSKVLSPPAVEHFDIFLINGMKNHEAHTAQRDQKINLGHHNMKNPIRSVPQQGVVLNLTRVQQLLTPVTLPLPSYCTVPSSNRVSLMQEMTKWVRSKLLWKCHHRITSSQCYKLQYIDPFTPCLTCVQAALAEDYAWTMGWCSATHTAASVPLLSGVELRAEADSTTNTDTISNINSNLNSNSDTAVATRTATKTKPNKRTFSLNSGSSSSSSGRNMLRLGFLMTVYRDPEAVLRLLRLLYSPRYIYVINVDQSSTKLVTELRSRVLAFEAEQGGGVKNVFLATGTPVVYMASSASQILVQGMQWFLKYGENFDYLIACTGSDYPLLPLGIMETVLQKRKPPFPSVMNWNHATWEDAKSMEGLSAEGVLAREVVLRERRPPHAPMESRGTSQFGIPLTCHHQKSYIRLQARSNMEESKIDSQWLFGKSIRKGKIGNVNAYEDSKYSTLPKDGVFRVWYKSDPATTAVFDRRSMEYIVNSVEGKKYYHFFKSMLLGSEEHYFISLLGNWKRTQPYVNQFTTMAVWNTWTLGSLTSPLHPLPPPDTQQDHNHTLSPRRPVGQKSPHTSFLSLAEWPILQGLSRNGVFFARKFAGKYSSVLLDQIDVSILLNKSFPAGEMLLSGVKIKKRDSGRSNMFPRRKKSKFASQDRSMRKTLRSMMH